MHTHTYTDTDTLYLYLPQPELAAWPPFRGWASRRQQKWWSHWQRGHHTNIHTHSHTHTHTNNTRMHARTYTLYLGQVNNCNSALVVPSIDLATLWLPTHGLHYTTGQDGRRVVPLHTNNNKKRRQLLMGIQNNQCKRYITNCQNEQ